MQKPHHNVAIYNTIQPALAVKMVANPGFEPGTQGFSVRILMILAT
jgi:hypothetical protein